MIRQLISKFRLHPPDVLSRALKKHVTETELEVFLDIFNIMRKEYKYGKGEQGILSLN